MLPFRVRKDAQKWFKPIEKSFASDAPNFEIYYFCLIAGLAAKKKLDVPTAETSELVEYFPGEYRAKGRLIVATFLSRQIESLGISTTERQSLHSTIAELVDPRSPSHLSDAGMKEINKYSHGGFEVISETFSESPRSLETFLPLFHNLISGTFNS